MSITPLTPATAGAIPLAEQPAGAGRLAGPREDALGKAAQAFEALFVKTLLDSAFKDGFAGISNSGQGGQINSLWTRQLADSIAAAPGLGLAQSLRGQLAPPADGLATGQGAAKRAADTPAPAPAPALGTAMAPAPSQALAAYRAAAIDAVAALRPADPVAGAAGAADADRPFANPADFVARLRPAAEAAAAALGVSPRILLAQAALETGWGQHLPGADSHNLFGIKADRGWGGDAVSAQTREYGGGGVGGGGVGGAWHAEAAQFRSYASYADSLRDYVRFVQDNPRYAPALAHGGSDSRYIQALAEAGYATDPEYAARVLQVADSSWLGALRPRESAHDTAL